MVKHKTGFVTSSPNSVAHSKLSYSAFDIQARQIQKHTTDLHTHYAGKNMVGRLTRESIQNLQWFTWFNQCILADCLRVFTNNVLFLQEVLRNTQKLHIQIFKQGLTTYRKVRTDVETIEE